MDDASETLGISTRREATTAEISLDGEFDRHGIAEFTATVEHLIDQRTTAIEIDGAGLTFIDSSGLRALVMARKRANALGAELRVARSSVALDRILTMTGLHETLSAPIP